MPFFASQPAISQGADLTTLLRAILLAHTAMINLLGSGTSSKLLADEFQMQDLIVRAITTKTSP